MSHTTVSLFYVHYFAVYKKGRILCRKFGSILNRLVTNLSVFLIQN